MSYNGIGVGFISNASIARSRRNMPLPQYIWSVGRHAYIGLDISALFVVRVVTLGSLSVNCSHLGSNLIAWRIPTAVAAAKLCTIRLMVPT